MTSVLLETPDELYHDMEHYIRGVVRAHQKKYGGDFEELWSEALEHYMRAFHSYDSDKSRFHTWLVYVVSHRLLDSKRREAKRALRLHRQFTTTDPDSNREKPINLDELSRDVSDFSLTEFVDGLSEDAQAVVGLLFNEDAPRDVRLALLERNSGHPRSVRSAIREVLKDFGWTAERITESFEEIGKALVG